MMAEAEPQSSKSTIIEVQRHQNKGSNVISVRLHKLTSLVRLKVCVKQY